MIRGFIFFVFFALFYFKLTAGPWIQTNVTSNATPIKLGKDAVGNVYAYCFYGQQDVPYAPPLKVCVNKISPNGNLLWSYVLDPLKMGNYTLDMAVDLSGNVYTNCYGYGAYNNGSLVHDHFYKISPAGVLIYDKSEIQSPGISLFAFNCDYSKLISITGPKNLFYINSQLPNVVNDIQYVDPNTGNLDFLHNPNIDYNSSGYESVVFGKNGYIYKIGDTLINNTHYYGLQIRDGRQANFGNIASVVLTDMLLNIYPKVTAYGGTGNSASADCTPRYFEGVAASCRYVYVYLGEYLEQRDLLTGALINSVKVPNGDFVRNMGIDVDDCGNIYVGTQTGVAVYNESLTLLNTFATPDKVFDVIVDKNGIFYACGGSPNVTSGTGFVAQFLYHPPCNKDTVIISTSSSNCSPVSATATANICSAPYTYKWSDGQTTQTATNLTTGRYSVIVTGAGSCGVKDTAFVDVVSSDNSIVTSISKTDVTCKSAGTASVIVQNTGTNTYSYLWSNGQTNSSISNLSAGIYYVEITKSSSSCKRTDTVIINNNCVCPDTSLKFTSPMCSNVNLDLNTLKTTTTSPGLWKIIQKPSGTNSATLTGTTFNAGKSADAGDYVVAYIATGGPFPNCPDSNARTIPVNTSDQAKITRPQGPFCVSDVVQTIKLDAGASVGVWKGKGITDVVTGKFDPDIAKVGTHLLTYKTQGVCPTQDTISIVVVDKKYVDILTADTTVCQQSNAFNILLNSSTSSGGVWLENLSPRASAFDPRTSTTTTHKIYYVVQGFNLACSAADSVNITVLPNEDATLLTPSKLDFCPQDAIIQLQIQKTPNTGVWWASPSQGVSSTGEYNPAQAAMGKTKIYYGIAGKCGDTNMVSITKHPIPTFTLGNDIILCEGEKVIIGTSVTADTTLWNPTGEETKFITVNTEGNYALKLSNFPGCAYRDTVHVTVLPIPVIDLGNDTTLCFEDLKQNEFEISAKNAQCQYLWNTGETTASIFVKKGGKYIAEAHYSGSNCVTSDEITINAYCPYSIYFPNVFTPNGDGLNDKFPTPNHNLKAYHLMIFNRWGELIFESFDSSNQWDGTYQGQKVQEDVYVWRCDYVVEELTKNNAVKTEIGRVSVIR